MHTFSLQGPAAGPSKKFCIFGTGGFARETLCCFLDVEHAAGRLAQARTRVCFMVSDDQYQHPRVMGVEVIRESAFDPAHYEVLVAVGEPAVRRRVVERLPAATSYATLVHPTVVCSEWVEIGAGSILTAGVVLTCDIQLGAHAQLNLHTSIGHDCRIGPYFTAAPGARISGDCHLGSGVYVGSNAALRQGIRVTDNVTIGMGSVVVKSIAKPGVYVGNPLRQLRTF
ncbi:MAG: acetyltransferase [Hymenobacteraceae bacterium]|nr:acetyltransferase [Hymenobacteraceae bacterium]